MAATVKYEGHRLCKRVSFTVTTDRESTFICFCFNCQHVGGGALAYMKAMPDPQIVIHTGEELIELYEDWDNLSGNVALRYFCSYCGSPMYGKKTTGKTIIHIGCLDGVKNEPECSEL